ncbi:ATP-dependent DNA helicase PIF1 [Colletotrichum siamense]|uniref:ATP-dependent DNA helicase n=1 Tax=Colletotrichum siamense TaxID=690259 RepID=A0A9P5EK76_COLSI|nr:ATP-dependent DNA helicase PIF1 [Colletotrichum siamense]KAF4848875.1 ATP-dependent DNA helicase PIF1 [Colletotrichum siamense]
MVKSKPARDTLVGNPRPASQQARQAAMDYIDDERNPVVLDDRWTPKYYVVYNLRGPQAHGRKYGIFTNWNDTKVQTEGCKNKNTTASTFDQAMNLLVEGLALEIDDGSLLNYPPVHPSQSTVPAPAPASAPAPVKRPREEEPEPDPETSAAFIVDVHRSKKVKHEENYQSGTPQSPIMVEDDSDQEATQEGQDFCEAAIRGEGAFEDEEEAMREAEGFIPLSGYSSQTNEYIKRENDRRGGGEDPPVVEEAPELPLCPEQQHALDLAMQGHNLFITGSGGCGKSVLVKALNKAFDAQEKTVYLVAPTGQAATNINGRTTYSYAGWSTTAPAETLRTLIQEARRRSVWERIMSTDVLIIDEISMVESEFFNRLSDVLIALRREAFLRSYPNVVETQTAESVERPFGGIQVIAVGDFCQLPPVLPFSYCTEEVAYDQFGGTSTPCGKMDFDKKGNLHFCPRNREHPSFRDSEKWAFNSRTWEQCNFQYIHLTKIHRQTDERFITMLQNIRLGHTTDADLDVLLQPRQFRDGIALFSHKQKAKDHNNRELNKLPSRPEKLLSVDYPRDLGDNNDKHRFDKQLTLKAGMPVVLLANLDVENGLCNGSQGKLLRFVRTLHEHNKPKMPEEKSYKGDHYAYELACARYDQMTDYINGASGVEGFPEVIFANGQRRVIVPYCNMHDIETAMEQTPHGSRKVLTGYSARTQIPLVPGWAMTIHKSQSLSLDRVIVNLEDVWDGRQTYVALSRARSLGGLKVIGNKAKMRRTLPLDPECDGNPIQFSACKYRESDCEYVHTPNNRKPPKKEYVAALQARVKSLEAELARVRGSGEGGNFAPVADTEPRQAGDEDERMSPESSTSHGTSGTMSVAMEEVTDILGRFAIGDGGELCYFGSRSNLNLLRSATIRSTSNIEMQRRGYEAAKAQVGLVVTSQDLQTQLLDLFWKWQNSWQYIVCKAPFLQDLSSHPGSPFGRFCSPALFYTILALASRYTDDVRVRTDPNDSNTAGDAFAAQARVMLHYECEAPTPTTVQALALTCLREMAVDKEALGWMYCGMCVRMAMNLGMHLDCSSCLSEGTLSAEEAEVRNVTWWGCYVLDKLFNIGLGRPSMIQARDVTAELPNTCCVEELEPWQGASNLVNSITTAASHSITNAIYTCKLFGAMGDILDAM